MVRTTIRRQKDAPAKPMADTERPAAKKKTGIRTSRIAKGRSQETASPSAIAKPGARKKVHDVQGRPQKDARKVAATGRRA